MITRVLLFSASILISIGLGFILLSVEQLQTLLRFLSYPLLLIGFVSWIYYGFKSHDREAAIRWIKRQSNIAAIVACLIGTTFLYTRESREYKIVYDEPTIINTSLNLHLHRDPVIREPAHSDSVHHPSLVDKRPFFFAFLVSLLHDALGYNIANGHIVNFLLTFGFLIAVYRLLSLIKGPQAGFIGIAAFCTLPLMAQNASGLGFEIANLLLLACTMIAALSYWKRPSNTQLGFFLFSIILLAHTRYESALYVLPAGLIILSKWIQLRKVSLPLPLILCPLFFMPLAWQNRIVQSQAAEYMQLDSNDLSSAFGIGYILPNLKDALSYFSGLDQTLAGSLVLGPIGLISLAVVLGYLIAKPRERILKTDLFPLVAIGTMTVSLFLMLMTYYWGTLTDSVATRLSLPLWFLMLLSLSVLLSSLAQRYKHLPTALIALAFVHAFPIMATHSYSNNTIPMKRYEWIEKNIGQELGPRTLVVSNLVRMYQNRQIPSFNIKRLNHTSESIDLHLHLKTYEALFVVQHGQYINYRSEKDQQINDGHEIAPMYELELVAETSLYPYNFTRISRIVGVDWDKMTAEKAKPIEERLNLNKQRINLIPVPEQTYEAWEKSLP